MRVLAVALVMALLPAASAAVAEVRVASDPADDVTLAVAGSEQPEPATKALDLVALDIREEVDGFWFTITVAGLARPGGDVSPAATTWTVAFRHAEQPYQLRFIWGIDGGWRTDMYRGDASGAMTLFSDTQIVRDSSAGTISSFVERDLLRDDSGAPPTGGHAFEDITVVSQGAALPDPRGGQLVRASDRMPDTGAGSYPIAWGAISDGPVRMTSPLPFRVSNGAATTYLFEVDITNLDDEVHRFAFLEPRLPQGWTIRFPVASLVLEAGENRTVPVLVSLPFAHSHGTIERVTLELQSDDPATIGRLEVGVLFLEVPQPSGHHPQLWFHTHEQVLVEDVGWHFVYTPGADVYMNALEDDPGDVGVPIRGYSYDDGYEWYVFLEPGLLTGLDPNGADGSVEVSLQSDRPLAGAVLTGSLILLGPETDESYDDRPASVTRGETAFGGRNQTLLGRVGPVAQDLSGAHTYEATLIMESQDVVPPLPGQTLLLRLRLEADLPSQYVAEPVLTGGTLILPLDEYADPVVTSFLSGIVALAPVGSQERLANPGDLLVLEANVTNLLPRDLRVGLELHGQGAAWARLHTPADVRLAPGASHRAQIVVQVPDDARDADRADLVLEVYDAADPAVRSLLRFVAHVDTEAQWDDDAGFMLVPEGRKQSPVVPLLLPLGLAMLLRRR